MTRRPCRRRRYFRTPAGSIVRGWVGPRPGQLLDVEFELDLCEDMPFEWREIWLDLKRRALALAWAGGVHLIPLHEVTYA